MFRSSYSCTNNSFCGMVCKPPMSCFLKFPYSERGLLPPLQWTQVEVNRHIAYLNTVWVGVGMAAPVLLIIAVGVGAFIYCKKRFACHQKDSFLFRTEVLVGLGGTVVQIITMPMLSLTPQELLCGKQCKSPTSHWNTGPHNESERIHNNTNDAKDPRSTKLQLSEVDRACEHLKMNLHTAINPRTAHGARDSEDYIEPIRQRLPEGYAVTTSPNDETQNSSI